MKSTQRFVAKLAFGSLLSIFSLQSNIQAQTFTDGCFSTPNVGTSFASNANVTCNNADLIRWTGSAWTGGWGGANITLPPPGGVVNTRAIWSGDGTVWTTGGEGFGLRLINPLVSNTTYTFAMTRVSHGTGSNGNFAPIMYTSTNGFAGTSYGALSGVGNAWTTTNISFTATGASNGHTWIYFHTNTGSGMFLGCEATILPMALWGLQAMHATQGIHVEWQVQDEEDYVWHIIERSRNGQDFNEVGRLASTQARAEAHQYTYLDPLNDETRTGEFFYRIRSIDQDGLEAFSPVVSTRLNGTQSFQANIYPNPFQTNQSATVELYASVASPATYFVRDLSGRTVQQGTWELSEGKNITTLQTPDLKPGMYFLDITASFGTCKRSFTILE